MYLEFGIIEQISTNCLLEEMRLYFNNDVEVIEYDSDSYWDNIDNIKNPLIALDIFHDKKEDFTETIVFIYSVNFDVSALRLFYRFISKKFKRQVTFTGCDELTLDLYCMYDTEQKLYSGIMVADDYGNEVFGIYKEIFES